VLDELGPLNTVVLQKVLYYCQAWNLVWCGDRLFPDSIEAWINGPVVPSVYARHRGEGSVRPREIEANPRPLSEAQRAVVEAVARYYGDRKKFSPNNLITLTHTDAPWRDARRRAGAHSDDRSNEEITIADMRDFYAQRERKEGAARPQRPRLLCES
jgi:uncharacterized phage-associated protein